MTSPSTGTSSIPRRHASAASQTSPPAERELTSITDPLAGTQATSNPYADATLTPRVDTRAGQDIPADQRAGDVHAIIVGGEQTAQATNRTISDLASPVPDRPATNVGARSKTHASLADPLLYLHAAVLDDLEKDRKANANRLRILTRSEPDEDGITRGFGLNETHPDVARLAALVEALEQLEHDATLTLQRMMRKHPLGPWVKATVGVGEKQAARLLAAIGDPYINNAKGEPRTVSALWAYCGLHVLPADLSTDDALEDVVGGDQADRPDQSAADDQRVNVGAASDGGNPDHTTNDIHRAVVGVAAKRRKGIQANWSTVAKTRAYLIATSCIKQSASPYRAVYDQRREHTAITHPEWQPGHSHNDALRITSKAILRDLWRAARDIHSGQLETDTQGGYAGVDQLTQVGVE